MPERAVPPESAGLRWFRKHRALTAAALAGATAVVGFTASVFPKLGPWLASHAAYRVGGSVGLVALVLLGWLYLAMDSSVVSANKRTTEANIRLAAADESCSKLQAELEELQRTPHPHDLGLFADWLALFPPGRGPRLILQNFNDRRWSMDLAQTIETFLEEWRDRKFADEELQETFEQFYAASSQLSTWMGDYGHSSSGDNTSVEHPKPNWGGNEQLQKYYATGIVGVRRSTELVEKAAEFENLAHRHLGV